jgi:hypothetical protein
MAITATIGIETAVHNFNSGDWANSLIAGTDGNFYGTTAIGAEGTGSLIKVTPAGS